MTPEQFCYWLQGFGELSADPPSPEQWKAINEHLAAVFTKVTPPLKIPGYIVPPPFAPSPLFPYTPPTIQPYIHDPNRVTCVEQIAAKPIKTGVLTC